MIKKDFPKVHFYDQDIVDLYNQTWNWIKNSWKHGTDKNGFGAKYFNYPKNEDKHQILQLISWYHSFAINAAYVNSFTFGCFGNVIFTETERG